MQIKIKILKNYKIFEYHKNIMLTFNQAKMIDILKFIEESKKSNFDLWIWVLDFCKAHWKVKKSDEGSIYFWSWKIFEQIKDTFFKWLFKDWKWKWDESPVISLITFIAKESWISTLDILYKMTYEELELVAEGVIWNINEQTKKWQQKNRLKSIYDKKKNRTPEEEEEIKKKLAKLKNLT